MKPEDVAAVGEWLQAQIGVPFVVVGGSAIGAEVPVATKDIDVLISRRDWQKVDSTLEHHSQAAPLEPMSGTIRGTVLVIGDEKIDLEFLSDAPFTGELGPEAFLGYVKEHGSREYHGLLYAKPAVVFYMRLSTDDWKAYAPSIERDILAGILISTLDEAVRIAERFRVREKIAARAEYVRRSLRQDSDLPRE